MIMTNDFIETFPFFFSSRVLAAYMIYHSVELSRFVCCTHNLFAFRRFTLMLMLMLREIKKNYMDLVFPPSPFYIARPPPFVFIPPIIPRRRLNGNGILMAGGNPFLLNFYEPAFIVLFPPLNLLFYPSSFRPSFWISLQITTGCT